MYIRVCAYLFTILIFRNLSMNIMAGAEGITVDKSDENEPSCINASQLTGGI